jgi:transmembrane sensor
MNRKDNIPEHAQQMYGVKTDQAWSRLRERINSEEKELRARRSLLFEHSWRVAASILLLAALSLAIWLSVKPDTHQIKTDWNQKKIVLADGSSIDLNGHSSLSYPFTFSKNERRVYLKGEAFFEITKDPNRPFIVETADARVQVFGTAFNVKAVSDNHRVEVWVNKGVVGLSSSTKKNNAVILHKGEFGLLENNSVKKMPMTRPNYLSWHTKVFRFNHTSLKQVVELLSDAYAKKIVLADSSLTKLKLTASFNNAPLSTVLQSIGLTFHLSLEEKNDQIVIRPLK